MLGDGRTAYDHDHDNEKTEVRQFVLAMSDDRSFSVTLPLTQLAGCSVSGYLRNSSLAD